MIHRHRPLALLPPPRHRWPLLLRMLSFAVLHCGLCDCGSFEDGMVILKQKRQKRWSQLMPTPGRSNTRCTCVCVEPSEQFIMSPLTAEAYYHALRISIHKREKCIEKLFRRYEGAHDVLDVLICWNHKPQGERQSVIISSPAPASTQNKKEEEEESSTHVVKVFPHSG